MNERQHYEDKRAQAIFNLQKNGILCTEDDFDIDEFLKAKESLRKRGMIVEDYEFDVMVFMGSVWASRRKGINKYCLSLEEIIEVTVIEARKKKAVIFIFNPDSKGFFTYSVDLKKIEGLLKSEQADSEPYNGYGDEAAWTLGTRVLGGLLFGNPELLEMNQQISMNYGELKSN